MNINKREVRETRLWQAHEMAAVKILTYALAGLMLGALLILVGCSSKQPVPVSILPPAAAPRLVSKAIILGGCKVISGHDRHGNQFTITNCPEPAPTNILITFDTKLVPASQWKQQYVMASTDLHWWYCKAAITNGQPVKFPKGSGEFYAIGQ